MRWGIGEVSIPDVEAAAIRAVRSGQGGQCYVIRPLAGDGVKIGFSKNVPQRFKSLRYLLGDFRVISILPGGKATELYLHALFDQHHITGELFDVCVVPEVWKVAERFADLFSVAAQERDRKTA